MIPIKVALSFAFAVLGLGIMWVGLFSWLSTTQGKRMGSGLTARPDVISAVGVVFEVGKRCQSVLRAAR